MRDTAIVRCAEDSGYTGEYVEYDWVENTPRTSLAALLVDKLHELEYAIKKL